MIVLRAVLRALGQIGDRRFRRVLGLGVLLSLALLVAVYALFLWAVQTFVPDATDIPLVGPVEGMQALLSAGSALLMLGLSVFLMVPVASAFTGLFLDDVIDAVEARHYPHLPPAPRLPRYQALVDAFNVLALIVAVNLVALVAYAAAGPLAPVLFWAVNGALLGREYVSQIALRRHGRAGMRALRRRHPVTITLAGMLMAAPLSVPLVNLVIPVLGAATFTHLVHALTARG